MRLPSAGALLLGDAVLCLWVAGAAADGESCPAVFGGAEPHALSTAPRIYLMDTFLSGTEITHLRRLAEELGVFAEAPPDPKDSQDHSGYHQQYVDESRYKGDPLLLRLEERIAAFSHVPRDPGTGATISLSVRNATAPGMANVHHDHNAAAMALLPFVQQGRIVPLTELRATLLAYFSDVEEGGQTVFPCVCDRSDPSCKRAQDACKYLYENGVLNVHPAGHNSPFRKGGPGMREKLRKAADVLVAASQALCTDRAAVGLQVEPRAGRAILFFSNNVRGQADPRAWHGSCRVAAGQKLAMQRFLYAPQGAEETASHAVATFAW